MKKHRIVFRLVLVLLAFGIPSAFAASTPAITGQVTGTEWCFQFLCDFAAFSGTFKGTVDGKATKGSFTVTVQYDEPLPNNSGESTAITNGSWSIVTKKDVFFGGLTGTITNNDSNRPDTFVVTATLQLDANSSGSGTFYFSGVLDHNDFPPTIAGFVSQSLP